MLPSVGAMGVVGESTASTASPCLSQYGANRSMRMAPSGAVNIIASTEMMSKFPASASCSGLATLAARAMSKATGPKAA